MTDRANIPYRDMPTPAVITIASRVSVGAGLRASGLATPASGASPYAALDLLAFPILLTAPTYIYKAFWVNGATVGGNTSVGIYDADYRLITQTASTLNSGTASLPQAVTLVTKLPVGLYYVAMAHDSATTAHYFRWSLATLGIGFLKMLGCWRQASVTLATLPNPAVPVVVNNIAFPVYGLITRSGFDV